MAKTDLYLTSDLQGVQELLSSGLWWRTAGALDMGNWTSSNWCVQIQDLGLSKSLNICIVLNPGDF